RVGDASGSFQLAFGVPAVRVDTVVLGVTRRVVSKAREMIIGVGRSAEAAFLRAPGVIRVGGGGDGLQVAPGIEVKCFAPAVSRTCSERGSRECGGGAIQLVIGECLRASGI